MPIMKWDASLDIHVDSMNKDHQEILRLINLVSDQAVGNESPQTIGKTLKELAAFTVKHFTEEEKYKESIGYPDLSVHKDVHKNMLGRFKQHLDEFEGSQKVSDQFFNFLKTWLNAHIRTTDKKYGEFAQAKKFA